MVRSALEIVRLQRGRDVARLAGERCFGGAAPAQAFYQANAAVVEFGLPHPFRDRTDLKPTMSQPLFAQPIKSGASAPQMALACVMGDMDLLQPIAMTGIPCAVVTRL